jgi:hypothetical protein
MEYHVLKNLFRVSTELTVGQVTVLYAQVQTFQHAVVGHRMVQSADPEMKTMIRFALSNKICTL